MEGLSFEDWCQGFLRIAELESWPFPQKNGLERFSLGPSYKLTLTSLMLKNPA